MVAESKKARRSRSRVVIEVQKNLTMSPRYIFALKTK
jgi:hypothetical protein